MVGSTQSSKAINTVVFIAEYMNLIFFDISIQSASLQTYQYDLFTIFISRFSITSLESIKNRRFFYNDCILTHIIYIKKLFNISC